MLWEVVELKMHYYWRKGLIAQEEQLKGGLGVVVLLPESWKC